MSRSLVRRHDAYELYGTGPRRGPLVVTCEHASNRVPRPLTTTRSDRRQLASHWGWDIGAANVAREIIRQSGSIGVLSRFSRLVCDANRHPEDADWVVTEIEGRGLSFNVDIDEAERARRRAAYYDPYHHAIDGLLTERRSHGGDVLLLAVHSFTPSFAGQQRSLEIGVLYDRFEAVGRRFAGLLARENFVIDLNQPYSGRAGMMFAANRHGSTHGIIYLEIEVRQDLITAAPAARAVGRRVARALSHLTLRTRDR